MPDIDPPPAGERPAEDSWPALAEYTGYLLQMASRLREQALDAELSTVGMTSTRLRVMSIIRRLKTSNMSELSFLSGIDRTTLTRTVDQLTEAGLVVRNNAPGDRRKVALSLTPKGARLHRKLIAAVAAVNRKVFAEFDEAGLRALVHVLSDLVGGVVTDARDGETLAALARSSRARVFSG